MEYEAKVEVYGLSEHNMTRLGDTFPRTHGWGPVCWPWTGGKLGLGIQFRVIRDTAEEAEKQARLEVQMAIGRLGLGLDGLEITVQAEARPDGKIPELATI